MISVVLVKVHISIKQINADHLNTLIEIFVPMKITVFFFYLRFLSRTFKNHRTAGEGGGHFFDSSPPLPPASQTLTQ